MSRIGRLPIPVPDGVEVKIDGSTVSVKGPKGEMTRTFNPVVDFSLDDGELKVTRKSDEKFHRAMHGTARSILDNMVTGVKDGFDRYLEIHGVGYRAELKGKTLVLHMGYSHPVEMDPPEGVEFTLIDRQDMPNVPGFLQGATGMIKVSGYDKEAVGQTAALVRKVRTVEPYKGKGIRYVGEYVRRKAGKAGKAAAA